MKFNDYTNLSIEDVLNVSKTNFYGLNEVEATSRINLYGRNDIAAKKITWVDIMVRQFASPFIYVLAFAAFLALFLGEMIDGVMIFGFILINTVLGFVQEYQSEKSLELLKKFVVSRARVIRLGKERLIDAKDLTLGDVVKVETGDIIPADLRFIEVSNLMVDESSLSGESVSVSKTKDKISENITQINEASNIGFSGSKIVSGEALGVVISIGKNTILGDVAKLTIETKRDGLFEKGIASFSAFILKMIISILVLVFFINLAIKGESSSVADLVLFSIALAVSVIPEALPVVTTLSLSKGALHLAKNHVVVKRLSAVEDLGSIDVLCTDKTGTLTKNIMSVSNIFGENRDEILLESLLASSFIGDGASEPNNSFDLAIWNFVSENDRNNIQRIKRIGEIPFDPDRRRNSVLLEEGDVFRLIVRGAPETIISLCDDVPLSLKESLFNWVKEEGRLGKRVVAVSKKVFSSNKYSIQDESHLVFMGAISFIDPVKETSKDAILHAKSLGLEIKILTGDNPEVAAVVAHSVGIISDPSHVITGDELDLIPLEKQLQEVLNHSVFARVSPRQKYHIIELLKQVKRVGFLGEGINDAPALKMANVALVVKESSDIAREASDIVLLDSSLDVIVSGIRDGRAILQNTVKYLKITLISNFGNFFSVAIASIIQLLLLNLLTDFPMIAIAMDNVDKDDIRKPQTHNIHEVVSMAVVLGLVSTIFDFVYFAIFYPHGAEALQTYWFIGSAVTELLLIYSVRTKLIFFKAKIISKTVALLTLPAIFATFIIPFSVFGQNMFKFIVPEFKYILLILAVALSYFVVTEIMKHLFYFWYSKWKPDNFSLSNS
jgi:P-type Mg2+ transporter